MFEVVGTLADGKRSWVGWNEGVFYGPLEWDANLRVDDGEPVHLPELVIGPSRDDPAGAYATMLSLFRYADDVVGDPPDLGEGGVLHGVVFVGGDEKAVHVEPYMREGRLVQGYWREGRPSEFAALHEWNRSMTRAVSLGEISPLEAHKRGWMAPREHRHYKPLPPKLWHVTTARSRVLEHGLRTREEVGGGSGGLGGGSADVISLSDDSKYARVILGQIREARRAVRGEFTLEEMHRAADKGGFGERFEKEQGYRAGQPIPEEERLTVTDLRPRFQKPPTADDLRAAGLEPVASGRREFEGREVYVEATRRLSESEKRRYRLGAFTAFARARDAAGGTPYVFFADTDTDRLAETPEDEIALLEVEPVEGAVGYEVPSEHEWRVHTGEAVQVVGVRKKAVAEIHVRPYIREGRPVAGYTRRVEVLDSFEDAFKLPKSGKAREAALHGIAAMDKVLHCPPVPRIPVQATSGKGRRGSYKRKKIEEPDGDVRFEPEHIRLSALSTLEDYDRYGISDPPLTFLHEVGHFLDNAGFAPGAHGQRFESVAAKYGSYDPEQMREIYEGSSSRGREMFDQIYGLNAPPSPLADWWQVVNESPEVQQLAQPPSMHVYETHRYLISEKELFARSFAQWVATRSGDERLLKTIRAWQELPETHTLEFTAPRGGGFYFGRFMREGEVRRYESTIPDHMRYRQWSDENFEPIAEALDDAFAEMGWLK